MQDRYDRTIDYLRISVTDRCNLRCVYCMPPEGVRPIAHQDVLSYEEIADFVRVAAGLGTCKVRLTGGEPLARKGLAGLVAMLFAIPGIDELCMTTNGTLLAGHAADLARAGLARVNISLDTVDPVRYAEITRGGRLADALAGIDAALAAGLGPVKLNCVVQDSREEEDAQGVAKFASARGCAVQYIRRMSIAGGEFHVVEHGHGGDCPACNRLRLSSDGWLRPCLFSDIRFSIREMPAEAAIRLAVAAKPQAGTQSSLNQMHSIGG